MQFELVGYKKYVEIEDYRASQFEGSRMGTFSYVLYPEGEKILDCSVVKGAQGVFWSGPRKEIMKGEKKEYIPYISYKDKAYQEALKIAVLAAIQNHIKGVPNGQNSNPRPNGPPAVQGESSFVW